MNAPDGVAWRLLAFAAACAVVFGAALGVGRLVGPVAEQPASASAHDDHGHADGEDHAEDGAAGAGAAGLQASQGGYTLRLATDGTAAARGELSFDVVGPDGAAVTAYDVQHEKELHLVVVRRDLTGFQHVHPERDESGRWRVPVALSPGAWRVLADFRPTGADPVVLGADLLVPGDFAPEPLGEDTLTAQVDGYDVALGREVVGPGEETVLTATVSRDGRPVTDLQPYLGASGHLVALREGDVGYLHVHPDGTGGAGPAVAFHTTFPTTGRYRLFLDFRHDGQVRTATFTVSVGEAGETSAEPGTHEHDHEGEGGQDHESEPAEEGGHEHEDGHGDGHGDHEH